MKQKALKIKNNRKEYTDEALAEELALQILINNVSFTITMRSPYDDNELVYGLLYSEGIIRSAADILSINRVKASKYKSASILNVSIDKERIKKKIFDNRQILSVSSCGLCGKKHMDDIKICGEPLDDDFKLSSKQIPDLFKQMAESQSLFASSGGTHAAAIFDSRIEMMTVKEDVGRHNAVDKCIGDLIIRKRKVPKILVVSGRVSYEIVSKAYMAEIPVLAAVSAPTSLAVETSDEFGITLIGFCRDDRMTVYCHEERVK